MRIRFWRVVDAVGQSIRAHFLAWVLAGLASMSAACAYSGTYFAPSAASGRVDYPSTRSASYGLEPKSWIYFSPPGLSDVQVIVRVSNVVGSEARAMQIDLSRNLAARGSGSETSGSTLVEMPVTLDSGIVEIDWADGRVQKVPVAFDEQNGLTFILHRVPGQDSGLPEIFALMSIPLNENPSEMFTVSIPAMTFDGHRLEFPVITFRRVNSSK